MEVGHFKDSLPVLNTISDDGVSEAAIALGSSVIDVWYTSKDCAEFGGLLFFQLAVKKVIELMDSFHPEVGEVIFLCEGVHLYVCVKLRDVCGLCKSANCDRARAVTVHVAVL